MKVLDGVTVSLPQPDGIANLYLVFSWFQLIEFV